MFGDNFVAKCRMGCWGISAAAGLLTLILVWSQAGFVASLFLAAAVTVFMALVLIQLFCGDKEEDADDTDDAPVETTAPASAGASAAAMAAAGAGAASTGAVKSGTLLKGEEEVANSKGDWKYEPDGTGGTGSAAKPPAGMETKADSSNLFVSEDADAEAGAQVSPEFATLKGTDGVEPKGLSGPRGGDADNLKEIKGVGPKLEKLLNEMGIYHFDQIAGWSADEIAWVDQNLKGFKGRVTRDDWISQAKTLAAGGDTEFSKRVDDGDVY